MSPEWDWLRDAPAHEVALGAALVGPSCAGSHLDRLLRAAPLRCPGCGGKGAWVSWAEADPSHGIQQTPEQRGRAVRDALDPGATTTGTDVGTAPLTAVGDDVWLCRSCGYWTREPLATMVQETADDLSVLPGHGGVGARDADGRLLAYVEGRLSLLDEEAREDYLDALTGGVACDYEETILAAMGAGADLAPGASQRRCRNAEDPEAASRPTDP